MGMLSLKGKKKVGSLFEQVVKEMKGHPITLILVLIALGASALGYNTYARAEDLVVLKASLEAQTKIETCRWISDKIEGNEDSIRTLVRDEADERLIIAKRKNLERFKERYEAANCRAISF